MTNANPETAERAWVEIDLGALVRNARRLRELTGAPLLPMVKANAYGLGAVRIARALEPEDPWGYGVATCSEAAELRQAGISRPIVLFTPLTHDPATLAAARSASLRPVIGDRDALEAWLSTGGGPFHIEIDTGMSRSGFRWHDAEALSSLSSRLAETVDWEGVFTHFHSADTDPAATQDQMDRFESVLSGFDPLPPLVHLANSAGAPFATALGGNLSRPGIFLYGGGAGGDPPEPVARLKARVVALRRLRPGDTVSYGAEAEVEADTTIATLAIGYGDGVPRALSSRGLVELAGAIVPIVGRVTMDMLMVDVEDLPVAVGDVATLFGGLVSLDDQAALAGTVSYELLTALAPRVTRKYLDS